MSSTNITLNAQKFGAEMGKMSKLKKTALTTLNVDLFIIYTILQCSTNYNFSST